MRSGRGGGASLLWIASSKKWSAGKPIAAICHGPWALIEAGLVEGKELTSFASLQTDVRNAGGTWVDRSVVTDVEQGFTLVTSRDPDDLEDFVREASTALAETA